MTQRHWRVETRVTATRIYFVDADNEKEAEARTTFATPDFDEVDNEETMSVVEIGSAGADGEYAPEGNEVNDCVALGIIPPGVDTDR